MIYLASMLVIICLLAVYSFIDIKRRNEELRFKNNSMPMKPWDYSMKNKGDSWQTTSTSLAS